MDSRWYLHGEECRVIAGRIDPFTKQTNTLFVCLLSVPQVTIEVPVNDDGEFPGMTYETVH
jgi:hypothetical protein